MAIVSIVVRLVAGLAAALWLAGAAAAGPLALVMVEQPGCVYCARWHAEIGPAYPASDEGRTAPLRRVHLREIPPDLRLVSRPVFTPTFILVAEGAEIGRIEGYPGDQFFWPLLAELLARAPRG